MSKNRHSIFKMFDVQSVFFIPVWRRVALVAACWIWAAFEWWNGGPGWAILFAAIGAYCAHQFFIAFDQPEEDD